MVCSYLRDAIKSFVILDEDVNVTHFSYQERISFCRLCFIQIWVDMKEVSKSAKVLIATVSWTTKQSDKILQINTSKRFKIKYCFRNDSSWAAKLFQLQDCWHQQCRTEVHYITCWISEEISGFKLPVILLTSFMNVGIIFQDQGAILAQWLAC